MRIGLFGGSFNPAHAGHVLVAERTLARLGLDALWVMVSPGNPLKSRSDLRPLDERVSGASTLMQHPRVIVTAFEAALGLDYTYETVRYLHRRLPGRKLVWIMGADSMVHFHLWENWQEIADSLPMAIYGRPGSTRLAPASRAARRYAAYRLPERDALRLADCPPPAWIYLTGSTSGLSSTAIRASSQASR